MDQNGDEITWSVANFNVPSSGTYLVDLSFIGSEIGGHQVDGPYFLKDVSVYNQEGTAVVYFGSLGTTNSYDYAQFESPPKRIYLPLVARNIGATPSCSVVPTLVSPTNGSALDNLIPLFQWNSGNDPIATTLRLDV